MKNKKFSNIRFNTFFEPRAEQVTFLYDGIITAKNTYKVDNIRAFTLDFTQEYLIHNTEWPIVDNLVLAHWVENGPDISEASLAN